MAPSFIDAGLDSLVIASPGYSRVFVWFNDSSNDTCIATRMHSGPYTFTAAIALMANRTTGVVPLRLSPCGDYPFGSCLPMDTQANLTVWLTTRASYFATADASPENTTVVGPVLYNKMVMITNGTGPPTAQGLFHLTVNPRIYIKGTEDHNITLPISQLVCGSGNTSTAVLGVMLSFNGGYCGTTFLPDVSCTNPPPDFNFLFRGNQSNCPIVVNTTHVFTALLFNPDDYAFYLNSTATGVFYLNDNFAGYSRPYLFTASQPFATVQLVPGQSANVTAGGVSVIAPPLLPPGLNGTLLLEKNPKSKGSASPIAAVGVHLDNGTEFHVSNLSEPLQVTIPLEEVYPLPCQQAVCHYWDTQNLSWSTEGCETLPAPGANSWICSCNHATDFSLLLLDSQDCSAEITPMVEPFFAYGALYIVLGLVAAYTAFRVIMLRMGHLDIIMEHIGLFIVCAFRAFLCLYQTGVSGLLPILELSAISAVPRLIEFMLFSFIVATWGALLHFSMGSADPFKKARPYFIGVNVFAAAITIYIFVAFGVSPSFEAAVVGEALLTFNSVLLSVGFMVYATWLHKQFGKVRSTAGGSSCCPSMRIVPLGWLLSACFLLQAIFALVCISTLPQGAVTNLVQTQMRMDLYNGLYRLFNLLTLGCIVALYSEGIRKMMAKKEMSRLSTGFSSSSAPLPLVSSNRPSTQRLPSGYDTLARDSTDSNNGGSAPPSPGPPTA